MPHKHAADLSLTRAEGHSYPNLACARRNRIRDHTIDANQAQHQRHSTSDRQREKRHNRKQGRTKQPADEQYGSTRRKVVSFFYKTTNGNEQWRRSIQR